MKSILFFLLLPLIATTAQTVAPTTHRPTRAPKPPTNAPASGAAAPPTQKPTFAPIAPVEPDTSSPTTHRPTHRKNLSPTPEPTPTRGGADDDFGQDIDLKERKDPNAFVAPTSTTSTGLSAGGKAGIAITVLVLVGGLIGFFLWKRKSGKAAPRAVEVGVLDADGSSLAAGNGTEEGDSVDVDLSDDKVEDAEGGDAGSRIIL